MSKTNQQWANFSGQMMAYMSRLNLMLQRKNITRGELLKVINEAMEVREAFLKREKRQA